MHPNDTRGYQVQREQAILAASAELLRRHGSMAMRILDIAKAADISVGTFYAHFESKEDLILALMAEATSKRLERIEKIFANEDLSSDGRLIAGMFCNFLFAIDHPGLFAAEELAATRSVWEGATEDRIRAVKSAMDQFALCFKKNADAAIQSGDITPWEERHLQVEYLNQSAWYLMAGSTHVMQWRSLSDGEPVTRREFPEALLASARAMLIGFGWKHSAPDLAIREYARIALGLDPKFLNP